MQDLRFPDQGLNPCPLQWKHRALTTGPPGKSLKYMKQKLTKMKEQKQSTIIVIDFKFLRLTDKTSPQKIHIDIDQKINHRKICKELTHLKRP